MLNNQVVAPGTSTENTLKSAFFADVSTTFVRNVLTPVLQKFSDEGKLQGDVNALVDEAVAHLGATPAKTSAPSMMMGGPPMPMANPIAMGGPPQLAGTGASAGRKSKGSGPKAKYPEKANPPPDNLCQRYKIGRTPANTCYCAKTLDMVDPKQSFTRYCASCVKLAGSVKDFVTKYGKDWESKAMSGAPAQVGAVSSVGGQPPMLGQPMMQQAVVAEPMDDELQLDVIESGNYNGKHVVSSRGWPRFLVDLIGEGDNLSVVIKGVHEPATDTLRPCNSTELGVANKFNLTVDQLTPQQAPQQQVMTQPPQQQVMTQPPQQ